MSYFKSHNLEFIRGDSFNIVVNINGDADFTDASVKAQVRDTLGRLILDLKPTIFGSYGGAIIEIDRPPLETESLLTGVFNWDLELTYSNGIKRTYLLGTFTIKPDYSY